MIVTDKPLTIFDIESTGVNIQADRIVQLAIKYYEPGREPLSYKFTIDPERPISPEATEVHGITDEDVKGKPLFNSIAPDIFPMFQGSIVAGYNLKRFDVPMIANEFYRAGFIWKPNVEQILDAIDIVRYFNPNTLEAAYKRYTGKDIEDAHDAMSDTQATDELLHVMIEQHFGLVTLKEIREAIEDFTIDVEGKFYRDEDGDICFTFGKHKGEKCKDNPGFCKWMQTKDFSQNSKRIAMQFI